jgi:signal transduction histidine kinase
MRSATLEIDLDVTEARLMERRLHQAQKMEVLGTVTGGVAHDFNNGLAAIIGFTELMRGRVSKGSPEARYAERIMQASLRCRELVKQMLTFSRQTGPEKEPLLLSSIIKETVQLIRATTPSTISIRATTLSESGAILGDPTQIQQVLMNLCTNAVYAMREKGGVLDIELSDSWVTASHGFDGMKPGFYAKLVVQDTGPGIAPEIIDKVFDPFFTTKKLGEGTGLGLSVVHGIVKQSNGYVTVKSDPETGSTFAVYLPKIIENRPVANAMGDDEPPAGEKRG